MRFRTHLLWFSGGVGHSLTSPNLSESYLLLDVSRLSKKDDNMYIEILN